MTMTDIFGNQPVAAIAVGRSDKDKQAAADFLRKQNKHLIELNQQHTTECLIVTANTSLNSSELTQPADALLSDRTDVVLSLYTADCVPVLLTHRPNGTNTTVIGAVHAGRKGTEAGVLQSSLTKLIDHWGAGQTTIWLGPHICERCYEINREPSLRYNLRGNLTKQVESILPENAYQIMNSEHCTQHEPDQWYSYRREGKGVPMNYSYIALS